MNHVSIRLQKYRPHLFTSDKLSPDVLLNGLSLIVIAFKFIKFETMGSSNGNIDIPLIKISNRAKNNNDPKPIICIIGR